MKEEDNNQENGNELKNYTSLFAHLPKKYERTIQEISKDQC